MIAPSSAGARGGICCAPISPPAPAKAGGDLAIRPIETPDGFLKLETGRITASTLSRHLSRLGYDHKRMIREPPAIRFQAEHSNAIWHFDISSSDLKQLKAPPWIEPDRQGAPSLMLFSGVDDRSGVTYQEYRCVYGEDVESALKFLFTAMAPKASEGGSISGHPFHPLSRQWPGRKVGGV